MFEKVILAYMYIEIPILTMWSTIVFASSAIKKSVKNQVWCAHASDYS